jgi:RNA polymerase sigma-70 factor (ECF subfamily)
MTARHDGDDLFQRLYRRHYTRLLRFFRITFRVTDEDAEDLTQDTFVRFYNAMDEYRGEAEWAFLECIARNVAFNRVRSQRTLKRGSEKTESLDAPGMTYDPPAPLIDPIETMIETERRKRMDEAIDQLPSLQRRSVRMWLQGLRYDEISKLLRISHDAVKSRIRDAKRALQHKLGNAPTELPEDES